MYKLAFIILIMTSACAHDNWRTASRESIGIAPLPHEEPRAVVQVYTARAVKWRGYFAVHSWISVKEKDAQSYTTYQVVGFRLKRSGSALVIQEDLPDKRWYGKEPKLICSLVGEKAGKAIPKIKDAVETYPYKDSYRAYPGPNSNTFISYIIRRVSELGVELPPNAIGKDWINEGDLAGWSETGTGVQFSLFGLLGFTLGLGDGFEANLFGLSFGLDLWRPALKLPMLGRLGFEDAPVF